MWHETLRTPAVQIARLSSCTDRECARLLHGSDTCSETKAAILKRLRAANRSRRAGVQC
jgi:hypothetical protein